MLAMARAYERAGDDSAAKALLLEMLAKDSRYRDGLDELMQIYIRERDVGAMLDILRTWMANNPRDKEVAQALAELEKQLQELGGQGIDSP
jgi:thioredoxin-like negative regulator of GroEL